MDNKKLKLDELNRLDVTQFKQASLAPITLVLDNIRSAQNIGSIFRTADAFGLEKIILTGISATPPNKEILKTALGSTESVNWEHHPNTVDVIQQLKKEGYCIVSVEQTQSSNMIHEYTPDPKMKYVLVLGNEVEGVNQEVIDQSDITLEIPQFGTKHSLNVAVSAGIVIWDVYNKMFLQKN